MKKRTLIVAAILAATTIGVNAQTNLCLGEGVEATASSVRTVGDQINEAIDGNDGTRWQPNAEFDKEDKETADMVGSEDHFWYKVDFKEPKDFNLVRILWENSYIKGFQILVSNDNENWTKVYEQKDQAVEGKKYASYNIGDQNARYIKVWATDLRIPHISVSMSYR